MVRLWSGSRLDQVQTVVGMIMMVLWVLVTLNPELGDLGNPFSASVPVEMWFKHRLQWDPVIGCGSDMCGGS